MADQNAYSTSRKPWQRGVVWALITALANPAMTVPMMMYSSHASARDTDIYLAAENAGSTAEPAIMLILDTSDSMNTPEPWREYPGEYDSHVEYLWNDVGTGDYSATGRSIYNIGCTAAAGCNNTNTAVSTNDSANDTPPAEGTPHLPMGYFAPAAKHTAAALLALQADAAAATAAKTAAFDAEPLARAPAQSAISTAMGVCTGDANLQNALDQMALSTLSPINNTTAAVIDAMNAALASCIYDHDGDGGATTPEVPRPAALAAGTAVTSWTATFNAALDAKSAEDAATAAYAAAVAENSTAKADRKSMKASAAWYAGLNDPLDPGPRRIYRNYGNNGNWVWWVPSRSDLWVLPGGAGSSAENDNRLRSNAFNRFAVGSRVTSFGSTNGSSNPVIRAGTNYGNIDDFQAGNVSVSTRKLDEGGYNYCVSSMNEMMPSTVFAPGPYPKNSGKWENQRWARYERWGRLETGLNLAGSFSGTGPVNVIPPVDATQYPGEQNNVSPALSGGTYTRGYAGVTQASTDATTHFFGVQARDNQHQPIRVPKSDSRARWVDVRADLGGYVFKDYVGGMSYNATAGNGSLNELLGYYGVTELTPLGVSSNTSTSWRLGGWLGTSGAVVDFGKQTGTWTYYDGNFNTTTLVSSPNGNISHTATSGGTACTRTCSTTQVWGAERDFRSDNANVLSTSARGTDLYGYDACTQTAVSDASCGAAACSFNNTSNFTRTNNYSCSWNGTRLSRYVEGVGTLYYGGTCSGYCKGETCATGTNPGPNNAADFCNQPTSGSPGSGATWVGSYTIDGTVYTNVTKGAAGTCSDKGDTTQNCSTRKGGTCTYSTSSTAATACPNRSGTFGSSSLTYNYSVYNRVNSEDYLPHDCVADNGKAADTYVAQYNPGASYINALRRDFGTSVNMNVTAAPVDGDNNAATSSNATTTSSYTSNSIYKFEDDSDRRINVYSTNYLNWKFGAKVCRSGSINGPIITSGSMPADAVCSPVGRKTRLQIAKDALNQLIDNANGVRFGLMVFNKLPSYNDENALRGSQGANVVFPISPMGPLTSPNTANRNTLKNLINWLEAKGATPLTEATYEAYRYFRGEAPYFGTNAAISANTGVNAVTAVGGGNVADGAATQLASTDPLYTATWDGTKYKSPMMSNPSAGDPAKCQKNFILLISDGGPEKDTSADTLVQGLTQGAPYLAATNSAAQGTATTQFEKTSGSPYGPTDRAFTSNYAWLDELTYFMAHGDMSPGGGSAGDTLASSQSIGTYAIGFAGGSSDVLKHAAACGQVGRPGDGCGPMGSQYYDAKDADELRQAFENVLNSIRDWNATTSSPTVPISAYNRSESADDVFLAFFGPKQNQAWDGTVKKFKISTTKTECGVKPAHDIDTTKFIPLCLTGQTSDLNHISLVGNSYTSTVKNIEFYQEQANPDGLSGNGEFDVKVNDNAWSLWSGEADGGKAFKGGTGYILKTTVTTPADRRVYTHLESSSEDNLTDSVNAVSTDNTDLMSAAVLGTADTTEQNKRVNYIRGADPTICNGASTACNDASYWRTWPGHDVLHSRPVVVPYQKPVLIADPDPLVDSNGDGNPSNDTSYTTPVQYMYFISNEGLLHAVDTVTGEEKWAFMVPEGFGFLGDVMANATGEHITAGDGTPSVYYEDRTSATNAVPNGIIDVSEGDKVYMLFGLRRGGRAYYALDITAKDTPKFLWKVTPTKRCVSTSSCTATTDFAEMGETWSTPSISKMKITAPTAVNDPVAAFAGGYDPRSNDWIRVSTITSAGGVATVTTPVDHMFTTGDRVRVRGAETTNTNNAYNVSNAVITVTGPRSFTYTVSGTPPSPATAAVKRRGGVPQSSSSPLEVISAETAKEGRGVFFVNARTGDLIRSFTHSNYTTDASNGSHTMDYSMPSDVTFLNTDQDATGYADRLYVGDMGGNIWRFNIGSADSSTWTAYKFADLSGGTGNRKIFFPPAVLRNSQKGYHGIYIGTGDRENPLRTDQQDKFFMIKDKSVGLGTSYPAPIVYGTTTFKDVTSTPVISEMVDANSSGTNDDEVAAFQADLDAKSGWSMDLTVGGTDAYDGEYGGEKAINAPTVFFNIVRFGTYSPVSQPSPCLPPGQGLIYALNALTGEATDINLNKTIDSGDTRVINDFTIRGFASSGTMIIRDGKIWHLTVADGALKAENIGTAGVGRFTYWYQEPEQ